ncbi:MAG: hypothetical protein WCF90_06605 [Methanomicrobiales archaeon]
MECIQLAKLAKAPIKEIQTLEQKLEVTLVAYEKSHHYKKHSAADITKLKAAEKETGAILKAYDA